MCGSRLSVREKVKKCRLCYVSVGFFLISKVELVYLLWSKLISFPSKSEFASAWKILLNLPEDFAHHDRFVCSKHFADKDFYKGKKCFYQILFIIVILSIDSNGCWRRSFAAMPKKCAGSSFPPSASASSTTIKISIVPDDAKRLKIEKQVIEEGELLPAIAENTEKTSTLDHLISGSLPLSQQSKTTVSSGQSQPLSQSSLYDPEYTEDNAFDDSSDASDSASCFSGKKFNPVDENCASVLISQSKYIVFEECLLELFVVCRELGCGAAIDFVQKTVQGTAVSVKWKCERNHKGTWSAQPELKKRTKAGNILIPAAVVLCGLTYSRISELFELLNMPFISSSSYYDQQKLYIYQAVKNAWEVERNLTLDMLRVQEELDPQISHAFIGDGQADSPGHSAEFLSYTIMSASLGRVVSLKIVSAAEVDLKSPNMERLACARAIDELLNEEIEMEIFSSDRHPQIIALIRDYIEKGQIGRHSFDPFHVIKSGVSKKLAEAAKNSDMVSLREWKDSVVKHAWYSLEHSQGNPDIARDLWSSIIYHVIDQHVFDSKTLKYCLHPPLDQERHQQIKWMDKDSQAYEELKKVKNLV